MNHRFPSVDPPNPRHEPVPGQPAWDIALLYPLQGQWTREEYLKLTDSSRRLIEFTAGQIEVLPMPTIEHQLILKFLFKILDAFVEQRQLGVVLFAGTRVYVEPERFREPDVVFKFAAAHARSGKRYYEGADLVMEVVSDDETSRARDHEKKVTDYATGGVPEYWIVDPQLRTITVLTLHNDAYQIHGVFAEGQTATSPLLPGFAVNVTAAFAAARG